MLRVGIVGLGTISHIHQLAIEASGRAKLVAVCDTNEQARANYQAYPFYKELEDMLTQAQLDVLHVCLPHDLHVWASRLALRHGVNVFLEKPVALSYQEGKQLEAEAQKHQAKLGVCFQNRYNLTTQRLVEALRDPAVGRVKAVKGLVAWFRPESYYEAQPWRGQAVRAGGGTIINQSIHTLDLMQYLAGEVVSVKAHLVNMLDYAIDVEDTALARFQFADEVEGLYFATNAYAVNDSVDLQVICEKAKFTIKDYRLFRYDQQDMPNLIIEDERLADTKTYYGQGHKLCIQRFYQALEEQGDDFVSVSEALASMLMIDMMKQSNQMGQVVQAKEVIMNE